MKIIFYIFLSLWLWPQSIIAQTLREFDANGSIKWIYDPTRSEKELEIDFSAILNKQQLKTINSGFSTYSLVNLNYVYRKNEQPIDLVTRSCTVRLDTWEEIYDIAKLDAPSALKNSKDLGTYYNLCLKIKIIDQKFLEIFTRNGGKLSATLQIEQISASQSGKIKEWLINQQSGVIQGLFAHMLGKLTKKDVLKLQIKIPAFPEQLIRNDSAIRPQGVIN